MIEESLGERYIGHDGEARISPAYAARVLAHIHGMPVPRALHVLRFNPAVICPQIARIVQRAAADAARRSHHRPETLVVGDGLVGDGQDVIRVRRQAHGTADWITTKTTEITVEVRPNDRNPTGSRVATGDTTRKESL
ncbi:uL22 family ribosomal protein [Amycolatopsis rubida]|uniref:50S ribosomal protein L22 n=1 Tax=Amycolatopsis rubida TaxID=112413 RepID=A0A1I5NCQ9_9PSEU|nr:uL22 family ribosomal protein [Amycolatopsis rubida]SFP19492.1 Ribosomal protein L22 [Amycolatopsis rubida]